MHINEFIPKAKAIVAQHYNENVAKEGETYVSPDDILMVWFSKTLHNAKTLMITPNLDGNYYELTYNGAKQDIYFDVYEKKMNKRIHVGPIRGGVK